jgi:RimJ/RimL family protein N-acetyltransferase
VQDDAPAFLDIYSRDEVVRWLGPHPRRVTVTTLEDAAGPTDQVEIGWHLHPDHQSRGYATEAAQAVLDPAADAGIDQVLALTDLDNEASRRVALRLGMTDEGTTTAGSESRLRQYRKTLAPGG